MAGSMQETVGRRTHAERRQEAEARILQVEELKGGLGGLGELAGSALSRGSLRRAATWV